MRSQNKSGFTLSDRRILFPLWGSSQDEISLSDVPIIACRGLHILLFYFNWEMGYSKAHSIIMEEQASSIRDENARLVICCFRAKSVL